MRTVQDFVQDCIQRGKSLQDIKRIALCTRWAGQAREIEEAFESLKAAA